MQLVGNLPNGADWTGPNIAPETVGALLGPGWSAGRPRYRTLADRLAEAITSGELSAGDRLPAERQLAEHLGVSRSTVVSAYNTLREELKVHSRTGSGTFVAAAPATTTRRMHLRDVVDAQPTQPLHSVVQPVNLSVSRPEPLHDALHNAITAAASAIGPLADSVEYSPQGLPELRSLIAADFTQRGLPTTPRQILITSGAQQAIALIGQLYVTDGSPVVLESPTYLGAMDALRAAGGHLVGLPGTLSDVDWSEADAMLRRVDPALLFVMPTCHTITGSVTDDDTRRRLAELSEELQLPVIEDDIFARLTFDEQAGLPAAAYAEDAPIFTIGSTSKLLWNGLRVGWLRAPDALVTRLARSKSAVDLGTSLVTQLVTINLLADVDAVAQRRRDEILDRLSLALDLLRSRLPDWTFTMPQGGRSLWMKLPNGDATDFAAVAQRHGVLIVPGATLSPCRTNRDRLRVMFVHRPEVLAEGVERLSLAWAEYSTA